MTTQSEWGAERGDGSLALRVRAPSGQLMLHLVPVRLMNAVHPGLRVAEDVGDSDSAGGEGYCNVQLS